MNIFFIENKKQRCKKIFENLSVNFLTTNLLYLPTEVDEL